MCILKTIDSSEFFHLFISFMIYMIYAISSFTILKLWESVFNTIHHLPEYMGSTFKAFFFIFNP